MAGSDADAGDTLTFSLVSGPANGSVTVNSDGTYSFTPNTGFAGSDSFVYRVEDSSGLSTTATMAIDVGQSTTGGSSVLVDSIASTTRLATHVAATPTGGYVTVWDTIPDGSLTGVFAQVFDASGQSATSILQVNTTTNLEEMDPAVAVLSSGDFVVTWQAGVSGGNSDVFLQRFDSGGNKLGTEEIVHLPSSRPQVQSDVTSLSSGGFVVTWVAHNEDTDGSSAVRARIFDGAGAPVSGEIVVDSDQTPGDAANGKVVELSNGNILIAWQNQDASNLGTYGRLFDASGTALGGSFLVNDTVTGIQRVTEVTTLSDGGFVISYLSQNDGQSNGADLRARRFDASGSTVGGSFLLHPSYTAGTQSGRIVGLPDGGLLAFISSQGEDGNGFGAMAQRFDSSMQAVGTPIQVNEVSTFDQFAMSVDVLSDGRVVFGMRDFQNAAGTDQDVVTRILGSEVGLSVDPVHAGTPGNDLIVGGPSDDTLSGDDGNDLLQGGTGNDSLNGGTGNDTLTLGSGSDTVEFASGDGSDLILAGDFDASSTDSLEFTGGLGRNDLWFSQLDGDADGQADDLVIDVLGQNGRVTVQDWFAGGANADSRLDRIEAGADTLVEANVLQLVNAMATWSAANGGQSGDTLNEMPDDPSLSLALAAAWQT